MHSHIFFLGHVVYTDSFWKWFPWLLCTKKHLDTQKLRKLCRRFSQVIVWEVDVIEWRKYWNLLTGYCKKVNDGIVNAIPPMVCDICMLMLLC